MKTLVKVCGVIRNNVFGTVHHRMGLVSRWIPENRGRQDKYCAGDYL
ncbi:MAG: hypothetical protein WCP85_31545 [Mariniphaga sp.]